MIIPQGLGRSLREVLGNQSLIIAVMGGGSSSTGTMDVGWRDRIEEPALHKLLLKVTQWRIVIILMHFYNAFLWRFIMF